MVLYHGSKSGLKGNIQPISRSACDFGQGFYLGDREDQPKSLISNYDDHVFYTFECNFEGLVVKEFGNDYHEQMDWALFIAYNRKQMDVSKYPALCRKYEEYNRIYDVIIGVIADDKMTQALNRFFLGDLCDKALLDALKQVRLGRQYVLKSEKACREPYLKKIDSQVMYVSERKLQKAWNVQRIAQMEGILDTLKVKYRRAQDVKYIDEIMEEWNRA